VYTHPLPDTFDFASDKAYGFVLTLQGRGAPLDMSADDGLANCYMVVPGTTSVAISIERAVTVGGMDASATNVSLVELWDDNNVINSSGISALSGDGASRSFTVTATANEGNAGIALKGSDGTIYWSWHIWVSDYSGQTWTNNGFRLMDRNLGAANNYIDAESRGLLYQWGRKDPFPGYGTNTAGNSVVNKFKGFEGSSDETLEHVSITTENNAGARKGILESIRTPLTFYAGRTTSNDRSWLPKIAKTLWNATGNKKSIYDPCPVGYRVPLNKDGVLSTGNSDRTFFYNLTRTQITSSPNGEKGMIDNLGGYWPYAYSIVGFRGGKSTIAQHCTHWTASMLDTDPQRYGACAILVYTTDMWLTDDGCGIRCCKL
jgi:hypothetical protein